MTLAKNFLTFRYSLMLVFYLEYFLMLYFVSVSSLTYTYIHTYTHIHTCIHTYTHTHIHTYTHTYIHHTSLRTYIHTYIYKRHCTCTWPNSCAMTSQIFLKGSCRKVIYTQRGQELSLRTNRTDITQNFNSDTQQVTMSSTKDILQYYTTL